MMGNAQIDIDVPAGLKGWIDQQIATGRFEDADDYIRHLVRRDLEQAERSVGWSKDPSR